jgi:hypothetical protein
MAEALERYLPERFVTVEMLNKGGEVIPTLSNALNTVRQYYGIRNGHHGL